MNIPPDALKNRNLVVLTVPETKFSLELTEAIHLYEKYPAIEASIISDQDNSTLSHSKPFRFTG